MELKDTVELMLSDNYQDRFKAEFHQTLYRFDKLGGIISDWLDGVLEFEPDSSFQLLCSQYIHMADYLSDLVQRSKEEGINLDRGVE